MRLMELFDKTADYTVIFDDLAPGKPERILRAEFIVAHGTPNQRRYEVEIETVDKELLASLTDEEDYQSYLDGFPDDAVFLGLGFESEIPGTAVDGFIDAEKTTDITGLGNQFEVMSTVLKIAKEAVRKSRATCVFFGSMDPTRTKLYRTMSKRFGKEQASFTFPKGEVVFLVRVS